MKKFLVLIIALVWFMPSCIKSRQCQCSRPNTDSLRTFYINGPTEESQKACVGMADTTETCKLKLN